MRSNSLNPHSSSRSAICRDRADWLIRRRRAAFETVPRSATVTNVRKRLKSTRLSPNCINNRPTTNYVLHATTTHPYPAKYAPGWTACDQEEPMKLRFLVILSAFLASLGAEGLRAQDTPTRRVIVFIWDGRLAHRRPHARNHAELSGACRVGRRLHRSP